MLHLMREDDWHEEIQIGSRYKMCASDDLASLYIGMITITIYIRQRVL